MLSSRLRPLALLTCSAALAVSAVSTAGAAVAPAAAAARPVCSVGAGLANMPFRASPRDPNNPVYDFMQFTASRGRWLGGIAYRSASSDFYLLARGSGQRPLVLRKVHYPYAHATPNAVTAVGFTPQMQLVVAVQNAWYRPVRTAFGSYKGMYYRGRTGRFLRGARGWISYMPTAVSDSGRVAGWAATGTPTNPHYYAITWSSVTANPVVLADVGSAHPSVQMTGNGDIAWQGRDGITVVRKADGSLHPLYLGSRGASVGMWPAGASQDSFYAAGTNGILRWTVAGRTPSGLAIQGARVMAVSGAASWVDTVGPRGDLITGMQTATYRMPGGRRVTMPAQALPGSAQARVITKAGTIVFTSKRDRKVHFMSCR